jgi:glycosyltransferase involved in cell wall biosynthesis
LIIVSAVRISILIPTIGDTNRLQRFLGQLKHFSGTSEIEVLVIVNCAEIPKSLSSLAAGSRTILLHEPQRGKSRALNLGISASQGEWIVFTDDDVRLPKDWLLKLLPADIPEEVNIIGGRTLSDGIGPTWIERSRNLQELLLCRHDLGNETIRYRYGKYPIGPNMAVRRKALLEKCATWPVHQGPGTALPVGDESVFLSQISSPADVNRLYIADAVVYHPIDSRYLGLVSAARRTYQGGYACGLLNTPTKDSEKINRTYNAIRHTRSIKEFICSATRTIGVVMGNLARKRRGS